jgi:hypothetical protein
MKTLEVLPMFTHEQCQQIAQRVLNQSHYMIKRGEGFYTLGASTYLDDPMHYQGIAVNTNTRLNDVFGFQLECVQEVLSEHFSSGVLFATHLALPGFHIFDGQSAGLEGSVHIDEPYDRIDWRGVEWHSPFSFTVPLQLPTLGGGLDYWPNATDEEMETYARDGSLPPFEYLAYEVGKMYLHDGHTPHRISNRHPVPLDEYRISIQGHGVFTADGIIVYF